MHTINQLTEEKVRKKHNNTIHVLYMGIDFVAYTQCVINLIYFSLTTQYGRRDIDLVINQITMK